MLRGDGAARAEGAVCRERALDAGRTEGEGAEGVRTHWLGFYSGSVPYMNDL